MKDKFIKVSCLPHTWLIDIDGTILKHNAHLSGEDEILAAVKDFWKEIPESDVIILLSARDLRYKESTENFLVNNGLRFNHSIFGLPAGERILINDKKPSGMVTAIAVNVDRDVGFEALSLVVDSSI